MRRGFFDQSAIWSRTKIWRRNRSSDVWAASISWCMGVAGLLGSQVDAHVREGLLEPGPAVLGRLRLAQVQVPQVLELFQLFKPGVRHRSSRQVEVLEFRQ